MTPEKAALVQPYFDAAQANELVLPFCPRCERFHWLPEPLCPYCAVGAWEWTQVRGDARLFTWIRVNHAFDTEHADTVPFVVGLVELDGAPDVRLVTSYKEEVGEEPWIGMPMRLEFQPALWNRELDVPVYLPE